MALQDSVLKTIKTMIGVAEDDDSFDQFIMVLINNELFKLRQIGVVTEQTIVEDRTVDWSEIIDDEGLFDPIKTYIYCNVKLAFDPPQNSTMLQTLKDIAKEAEWRLYTERNRYHPD